MARRVLYKSTDTGLAEPHNDRMDIMAKKNTSWFDVDKDGLRKLIEQRPKSFAVAELFQNIVDTDATLAELSCTWSRGVATLTAEDDCPDGFKDLAHAYTMFAESEKKVDPTKRGRFNLGEKLVLALCTKATISSTTGTVVFDKDGRNEKAVKRAEGSKFTGTIKMTKAEHAEVCAFAKRLIVPDGIEVFFNGEHLPPRKPLHSFRETLYTEIADKHGVMQKAQRATTVDVYEPLAGHEPTLYEMGIPVCPADRFDINIGQKIPMNMLRDSVSDAWRRKLRVVVLNEMHELLSDDEMSSPWVQEATDDHRCAPTAVKAMVESRFGEDAVICDPSDREAEKLAQASGRQVIYGGALTKGQWRTVKANDLLKPAGQVMPSNKHNDETMTPHTGKVTDGMKRIAAYAAALFARLTGFEPCAVTFSNDSRSARLASFSRGHKRLDFNVGRLGYRWFDKDQSDPAINSLLIHEFGHHYSGDHLSDEYHDALCDLGAKLAHLALHEPEVIRDDYTVGPWTGDDWQVIEDIAAKEKGRRS